VGGIDCSSAIEVCTLPEAKAECTCADGWMGDACDSCGECGDVNGDGEINVQDVIALTDGNLNCPMP